MPFWIPTQNGKNTGDDIAGTVLAVGSSVTEYKPGDRVAAFHEMTTPHGSFAEVAIAYEQSTFALPPGVSFEAASAIPLAAMTAAVGLFTSGNTREEAGDKNLIGGLGLPAPWEKSAERREASKGGVVVYGAASAVGAYVIKLLQKSDIHPIICVAGRGIDFVKSLISEDKGDTIVDYRNGHDAVVKGIKAGVKSGEKLRFAFDAVSDHGSYTNIVQALDKSDPNGKFGKSKVTVVLPGKKYEGIPPEIELSLTQVGTVHKKELNWDFGYAWFRLFGLGLKEGWFQPHPHEVVAGGLGGVQKGLNGLKDGSVSAKKMVFRIEETVLEQHQEISGV